MLEAAVVLEAWAGMPAAAALPLGETIVAVGPAEPAASTARPAPPPAPRGLAIEAVAFVLAVVAIAWWAGPLSAALGTRVVGRALTWALPAALALQWGLASRYLGRPRGLVHLARLGLKLPVLAWLVLVAVPAAALGRAGALAGALTLTWSGGAILVRRGWSPAYVAIVLLAGAAMLARLRAPEVVAAAAALTTIAVALAVRGRAGEAAGPPGRWGRALVAAAIGAGVGVLLVADAGIESDLGAIPALGLLPASLASLWGGRHLWRFQQVIPATLAGVPLAAAGRRGLGAAPVRILLSAVGRMVALTVVLSALLAIATHVLQLDLDDGSVLVAFGLLALATLFLGLLESIGRGAWALLALIAGIAAEAAVLALPATIAGAGLIAGAAVALAVALPVALAALARPATTLATSMGIR